MLRWLKTLRPRLNTSQNERSIRKIYGSEELAVEVLTAFRDEDVPRDLPPKVAKASASADGQTRVRLNWLTFELHRLT